MANAIASWRRRRSVGSLPLEPRTAPPSMECLPALLRSPARLTGCAARNRARIADSRRIPGSTSMASSPNSTPIPSNPGRAAALREALASRVVVADGAMGTMIQAQDPTLDDFQQLEGCNEILNVTRPDIVRVGPRGVLRGGRRLRGDQHLRCEPRGAGRVRHHRPDLRTVGGGRSHRPRGGGRIRRRRPAALGAGLDGTGHEAAHPRPLALHHPAGRATRRTRRG